MSKIMVSIPEGLLKTIDAVAKAEHRSRSEFFREAARVYIEQGMMRRPLDTRKLRNALKRAEALSRKMSGGWDSTQVVREMREKDYSP